MPCASVNFVIAFALLFSKLIFKRVKVLLTGVILSPASRTVTNSLCDPGMSQARNLQFYQRFWVKVGRMAEVRDSSVRTYS